MDRMPSVRIPAVLAWALIAAVALLFAACAKMEPKFYNDVRLRAPVSVSPARKDLRTALSIYVHNQVPDSPQVQRSDNLVVVNVADYRKSIYTALEAAFRQNFPGVTQATQENPVGYQLVVLQAQMLETNQIQYHAALTFNGRDLVEVTGKTKGTTPAPPARKGKWQDEVQKMTVDAVEKSLAEMAEAIYQQIFFNKEVSDQLI